MYLISGIENPKDQRKRRNKMSSAHLKLPSELEYQKNNNCNHTKGRMNTAKMKKFLTKQLAKLQEFSVTPTIAYQRLPSEDEEFSEPHAIHAKPQSAAKVQKVPGRQPKCQHPKAENAHHLRLQISKIAAGELEVLSRLKDAEEALARQKLEQDTDRLALIRLEEDNARLGARVAQATREMEARDRALRKKFKRLKLKTRP